MMRMQGGIYETLAGRGWRSFGVLCDVLVYASFQDKRCQF